MGNVVDIAAVSDADYRKRLRSAYEQAETRVLDGSRQYNLARSDLLCLTDTELSQLTGKQRPSAQKRALRFMGIDHKLRPDGSLVVLRAILDPNAGRTMPIKRTEPNWG
jgi:hypothetical protein